MNNYWLIIPIIVPYLPCPCNGSSLGEVLLISLRRFVTGYIVTESSDAMACSEPLCPLRGYRFYSYWNSSIIFTRP